MNIQIKPIQLVESKEICIRFREDSFIASFGDAKKFYEADGLGAERYIEWLRAKINKDAGLAVHCWFDNEIVGQIELGFLNGDPHCGYVNLYYLKPDFRGKGFGKILDDYVIQYFKSKNISKLRLSVSPTNDSAVSFYKKNGWVDLGPRSDHPEVHFMEKAI